MGSGGLERGTGGQGWVWRLTDRGLRREEGEFHGQGTLTFPDGGKYEGEWKEGKEWNGKLYGKDGKIIRKFVNGVKQ